MNRTQYIAQKIVAGESLANIGRELGVSRQAVHERIKKEPQRAYELTKLKPKISKYGVTEMMLLRIAQNKAGTEVAKATGMSYSTYHYCERGATIFAKRAREIAKYYGVRLGELFELPEGFPE